MPPNSNMTAKIYSLYAGWHTHNHMRVESSSCCFPMGLSGSLHSSKTWGRFTLIEKNLDYSDSFQYQDTLYEYQLVAFGIHNNFSLPNKAKFAK